MDEPKFSDWTEDPEKSIFIYTTSLINPKFVDNTEFEMYESIHNRHMVLRARTEFISEISFPKDLMFEAKRGRLSTLMAELHFFAEKIDGKILGEDIVKESRLEEVYIDGEKYRLVKD